MKNVLTHIIPKYLTLISIMSLLALNACQAETPPTAYPPAQHTQPPNTGEIAGSYPAPEPTTYVIEVIPTPQGETSTVTGYILQNKASPTPPHVVLLALAKVIIGPDGAPMVARFDRDEAPHTLTDTNGRFVFTDIPPGQYALILDRISDAFMLMHPDTGEDFIITATAGEIVDLGKIVYNTLPGVPEGK